MSYHHRQTQDSLNSYFSALTDFTVLSKHLLEAKNEQSFEIWVDKLALIDKRALLLFARKHKNEIPEAHLKCIQRRFSIKI